MIRRGCLGNLNNSLSASAASATISSLSFFSAGQLQRVDASRRCSSGATTTTASSPSSSSSPSPSPSSKETAFASAPAPGGEFSADLQRRQMADHERFLAFLSKDNFVEYINCTPRHLCSASRIEQVRLRERKAMQRGQGRGLVATADIHTGAVLASAPLLASGIYADRLMHRARTHLIADLKSDLSAKSAAGSLSKNAATGSVLSEELRQSLIVMWGSLPSPECIQRVAQQRSGIRDTYVSMQAHLAMCLACERCNEESIYTSYFESLPHPAVEDKHVMEVYDGFLDHDTDPYGGLCHDYNEFLRGLRDEWIRNAVLYTRKDAKDIFVPPLALVIWAWRTVLARQMALPIYGKPSLSSDEKELLKTGRAATYQTHFVNWQMLHANEPEATLIPTLLPFFDLVDHGVSNVRIDVVTREIAYPSLPREYAAAPEDVSSSSSSSTPSSSSSATAAASAFASAEAKHHALREAHVLSIVKEAASSFDANVRSSRGMRQGLVERVTEALLRPFSRKKPETTAYVQLQALTDIKAGTDLCLRFAHDNGNDDHAFALYRFGFFPYVG